MLLNLENLLKRSETLSRCNLTDREIRSIAFDLEEKVLADYFAGLVLSIEDVMNISPTLEWREILEEGAQKIVDALGADSGSIRLHDPETGQLVSFGSFQFQEEERAPSIPLDTSIAGTVVKSGRSYVVPDIQSEPMYRDKSIAERQGLNSMIAVPLRIPRFLETEAEIRGSLQIYYREKNRRFDRLEIIRAEVLARRISHVVARKRIIDLYTLNLRKERLVEKIFLKLSNREGIKMRDLLGLMVPELKDILTVQSCALFSVTRDRKSAWLEICHPASEPFIEEDHAFDLAGNPHLKILFDPMRVRIDTTTERVESGFVLLRDPQRSLLSSEALKLYCSRHDIRSVLLLPLQARGVMHYFMMFCSPDPVGELSDWEIELLGFFGKEIMQALRMERLDDILHDLKNPAIAVGGFARRARRLLAREDLAAVRDKIGEALDVLVEETDRIQSISTSAAIEGRERQVDVGQTLKRRFRLNLEAIRQRGLRGLESALGGVENGLFVHCSPFELERVLDNLLLNATEAIPDVEGKLSARCFRDGTEACVEVSNTGSIPEDQVKRVMSGQVSGRGLGIALRFVETRGGRFTIEDREGVETAVILRLPLSGGMEGPPGEERAS